MEAYGCISNFRLTPSHNAMIQLGMMPLWYYASRATNMALHDVTSPSITVPKNLDAILGLGMKFCPVPRFTTRDPTQTLDRFRKDLYTKVYFAGRPIIREEEYLPSMRVESSWEPKFWDLPESILDRYALFESKMKKLFKKKRRLQNNLLPFQKLALSALAQRTDVLVVAVDKNGGPALIDTPQYIDRAYKDHLLTSSYKEYSEEEATIHMDKTATSIKKWLKKHKDSMGVQEKKYLNANLNPEEAKLPVFYLTLKLHKTPWTTRPIVSCSGSLLYHIGVWVDMHLQKIATIQPAYIESSRQLIETMKSITPLPPNCSLFKADAVSMYTNIRTNQALRAIGTYIHQREKRFKSIPTDALTEALGIVMKNNVFQFGNTYWLQLTGTAMGTPPAPTYANLTFAIHENPIIKKYSENLILYKRYIDDIIGIWKHHEDKEEDMRRYTAFKTAIRSYAGLEWDFEPLTDSTDYLDIVISLKDRQIHTTLFEKVLSLHLYIPPHSAHAPGVLTGLVLGQCQRIYNLCSDKSDASHLLRVFLYRLRARGYYNNVILPLFERAYLIHLENRPYKFKTVNEEEALKTRIFLHLEYHPNNPKAYELQQLWQDCIIQPPADSHLSDVSNLHGNQVELNKMTVAYSRPQNLGNLLSSRNLHLTTGPPVSSYRK